LLLLVYLDVGVLNYLKNSHLENDASDRDLPLERFYNARQRTALFKSMASVLHRTHGSRWKQGIRHGSSIPEQNRQMTARSPKQPRLFARPTQMQHCPDRHDRPLAAFHRSVWCCPAAFALRPFVVNAAF